MEFQFQNFVQQQPAQSVLQQYERYKHNKQYQITQIKQHQFIVDQHYKIIEKIGDGAYGVIVAAKDESQQMESNQLVAIKKIVIAFNQKIFTKRTLRELKLLRLLKHPNIVKMKSLILPHSRLDFNDIYCVQEIMQLDLYQVINNPNVQLEEQYVKFFMFQIMKALSYLHKAGIVHRDLKPRNILINRNCDLKICDFGLARCLNIKEKQCSEQMTDYVITRWYRAPEVLLSYPDYGTAVDVWSAGIIFAEIVQRKVFLPGNCAADQLYRIFSMFGTPEKDEIAKIPHQEYRKYIDEMPKKQKKDLKTEFPNISEDGRDLLQKMLQFDADKRITAEQALKHPFFEKVYIPEEENDEILPDLKLLKGEFEFENYPQLTSQQYKDLVYEEILLYHFPAFKQQYQNNINQGVSVVKQIAENDHKYINNYVIE